MAATKQSAGKAVRDQAAAFSPVPAPEMRGSVRLGRRTKELTLHLAPNALVVLAHADLDAVAAHALVACRPLAIINTEPFVTGRYPNRGPSLLLQANVPLYEVAPSAAKGNAADTTPDLFALLHDYEPLVLRNDALWRGEGGSGGEETRLARLEPLTASQLDARLEAARAHLDEELSTFAQNTLRYLSRADERALLLDPVSVPPIKTPIEGRPVLVVVRGDGYEADLRRLMPYLREQKPVVIAVDGAADALHTLGVRPHILLGDMDSVSDQTLQSWQGEIVVHAYANGEKEAPGLLRVHKLGLEAHTFPVGGTSEDAALLLAYEKGADLIVAVGTHTHLEDFLDKGRGGMASTFLVRLKVGSRLVDARGVSKLYDIRRKKSDVPALLLLVLAAAFPLVVLSLNTGAGQVAWRSVVVWLRLHFRVH